MLQVGIPIIPTTRILLGIALLLCAGDSSRSQQAIPDWARGAVWYQIFLDRFDNGYAGNDPSLNLSAPSLEAWRPTSWSGDWYASSEAERAFSADPAAQIALRGCGGDLNGLLRRLDYLDSLGAQVLRLSPIFESPSFHRFDASSFHHVDPSLGGAQPFSAFAGGEENPLDTATWRMTPADSTFLRLIAEAHRRHMRVVIDAEFSHASDRFWAYKDLLRKQQNSPFADWFAVQTWDDPLTPGVNEFRCRLLRDNPEWPLFRGDSLGYPLGLRNYLFLITRRWMDPNGDGNPSDGVDGWCLRSPGGIPVKFLKEWVRYTKRINPHSIVAGEPAEKSAAGDYLDLRFDHRFAKPLLRFFASPAPIDASRFDEILHEEIPAPQARRPDEGSDDQVTLLSSFDDDRILPMIARSSRPEAVGPDRIALTSPPSDDARMILRLISLFQFAFTGSPSIFYGDEAGLWGTSPIDRLKPMPWPELRFEPEHPFIRAGDTTAYRPFFDAALAAHFRRLALLRREHVALQSGAIMTFVIDNRHGVYGFKRKSGSDEVFCVFNASGSPQSVRVPIPGIREGTRVDDPVNELYFYAHKDRLEITLPPKTGSVLIPAI